MASTRKKTTSSTDKTAITNPESAKKATARQAETNTKPSKSTTSKTASSRTMRKPAPAPIDHVMQSVVFTQNELDQELLEAIEQELEEAEFTSFDELCKEALYQFLWPEAVAPSVGAQTAEASPAGASELSIAQLAELHDRLADLEQSIVSKTAAHSKLLGQHLRQIFPEMEQMESRLMLQMEGLEAQVASVLQLLTAGMPEAPIARVPMLDSIEEPDRIDLEPPVEVVERLQTLARKIPTDRDPFLDRLSALLEDF